MHTVMLLWYSWKNKHAINSLVLSLYHSFHKYTVQLMISVPQMCNPWFGWVSLVRSAAPAGRAAHCWTDQRSFHVDLRIQTILWHIKLQRTLRINGSWIFSGGLELWLGTWSAGVHPGVMVQRDSYGVTPPKKRKLKQELQFSMVPT